jgi:hypothetical protein
MVECVVVIAKSREIQGGVDMVWEALVDWANETKYWNNVKNVKVLRTDGNIIEREATVGPRGFAQKTRQTLVLDPKKSIKLTFEGESIAGEREILLVPLGEGRTKVDVAWSLELKNVPDFVQGIVQNQIANVTKEALNRLAEATERATVASARSEGSW